jgi:hypothetical protein
MNWLLLPNHSKAVPVMRQPSPQHGGIAKIHALDREDPGRIPFRINLSYQIVPPKTVIWYNVWELSVPLFFTASARRRDIALHRSSQKIQTPVFMSNSDAGFHVAVII